LANFPRWVKIKKKTFNFSIKSKFQDIVTKQLFEVVKNNKPDEVANVLKNPNCDVKSFRHGRTALHYAAMRGELVIIEQLISAGADVNAKSEKDFNESIVHCAAVHSSPLKVFNLLEKAGATFLVQDSEGANPLHLLVGFDRRSCKLFS
jgi:ankyrin repeat protein